MINGYYDGILSIDSIKSVWTVGDQREIEVGAMDSTYVTDTYAQQTVTVQILDFEHDDLATPVKGKTKSVISIDLDESLVSVGKTGGYMEPTADVNTGGWNACPRRSWCNNTFFNALPDWLKALVKTVNKNTSGGTASPAMVTSQDKCFLPSQIEYAGSIKDCSSGIPGVDPETSYAGEGTQYKLYADSQSSLINKGVDILACWTRSPDKWNNYVQLGNSYTTACYLNGARSNTMRSFCPAMCL
jgi:hypothetical protein